MLFKELRDSKRVGGMPFHAEVQRLDALQKEERIEGGEGSPGIAQALHAGLEDKGQRSKCVRVGEAMVRRVRCGEVRKATRGFPVKSAGIDDDAADGCAMPANIFRCRFDDNVRTPLDRTREGWGGAGVVDDQRQAMFMRDSGKRFYVSDIQLGIAERLCVDGLGSCW